jgi:uncharacterized RDD family membrane protein YckC
MTAGRMRGVELLLGGSRQAYDPHADSALFEGVLQRRIIALMIDLFIIAVPVGVLGLFVFLFCTFSLKTNWTPLWLLAPLSIVWAPVYYGTTIGEPASATMGMQAPGIELRTWYGARCFPELGAAHGFLFWVLAAALTPLVLVVGMFNARHQLLHDLLLGVVVVRAR